MKILIIGSGGREHALAWRLKQSEANYRLIAAPGNPGIRQIAEVFSTSDYLSLAREMAVDLTVVGPEAPLVGGIVDQFRSYGMPIVGPTAENAQLEGSKVHSKRFMHSLGITTARFDTTETLADALAALKDFRYPLVIKTDGLAAGKGVIIASTPEEAHDAVRVLPCPLVIEEFLEGEEISFIALCDGHTAVALEPSQDHKRIFDGDEGPNTGGMGAYSASGILTAAQRSDILEKIINPVVRATHFTGFLYAGLMMTADGPSVLEFNVRMGDPETQPLMMRLESDLGEALLASATGRLREEHLRWSPQAASCVVMAARGYPGTPDRGHPITGIENVTGAQVFHAGTSLENGRLVTAGGRVLGVTALGTNLRTSLDAAYDAVGKIGFEGMQFRKDIGAKGLRRGGI